MACILKTKNWQKATITALIVAAGNGAFAESVVCVAKRPVPQRRVSLHRKIQPKKRFDFRHWRNDPKVDDGERIARKLLGLQIYGAVDCGTMCSQVQTDEVNKHQKVIRQAVDRHLKHEPFIYRIQISKATEGLSPSVEFYITRLATYTLKSSEAAPPPIQLPPQGKSHKFSVYYASKKRNSSPVGEVGWGVKCGSTTS